MRVVFVRHGQSTANTGQTCEDIALIELTQTGHDQACEIAARWKEVPNLIVTSPFFRTRQTAEPTRLRFPDIPMEVWPVEEFTYLQPALWNGSTLAERMPHLERYWARADPHYRDGDGAESFTTLLDRARSTLARLAALPHSALVYVFSHTQFIQAVRTVVVERDVDDRAKMLRFWRRGEAPAVANGEALQFRWEGGGWELG